MAYLDHAATTPLRPEARAALLARLDGPPGNPSGSHRLAKDARRCLDDARDAFAAFTGFGPGDIVFTGGGTEADNLAVRGVLGARGGVAVCAATEHHAVLAPVESAGGRVVGVDRCGRVDLDRLADALDPDVTMVSVMAVNNETGIAQDLAPIVRLVRERAPRALVHTDAVQAAVWQDLPTTTAGVDLLSLSAHKFGGPQGVGLLAVRGDLPLAPQLLGGGQERERRSGTQNVAGVAAAAAAAVAAAEQRDAANERIGALTARLRAGVLAVGGVDESGVVDGDRSHKVPGSCHLLIDGVESEALLVLLSDADLQASAAASCASGAQDPSHVLAAMGVSRALAAGSLRLTLGWSSTDADVDAALAVLPRAVERLRGFRR